MRYDALLIDLDGVIRHWPESDGPIETTFGLATGSIRRAAFSPELLDLAVTGVITDGEWRRRIAHQLRQEGGSPRAEEAVARWSQQLGIVDREVLTLLARRRESVKLVLVTNATSRLARDLDALSLAALFHGVVNSSELGAKKPAEQVFRAALRQAGTAAKRALFIDDTPANVAAAATLGIKSHRYAGHDAMSTFLREAGIFPGAPADSGPPAPPCGCPSVQKVTK